MNNILKNIFVYALVIGIALLIKFFVFSPIKVNGSSMEPNLKDGDIMILNEIGYRLGGVERFDIVVINTDGEKIIKRIIGLPGEQIEYRDNKLYVNGEEVVENFKHGETKDFSLSDINLETIPSDHYFVVGDNRGNSKDSRIIGAIHKSKIVGKANLIIFPFDRIYSVK